jgi:hypothetical protein
MFEKLIGQRITVFCAVYIYTGKLVEVDEHSLKLEDAAIVYETGAFDNDKWVDAQNLPQDWYIQKSMVESWGILK